MPIDTWDIWAPKAGVAGDYELPDIDAGNNRFSERSVSMISLWAISPMPWKPSLNVYGNELL